LVGVFGWGIKIVTNVAHSLYEVIDSTKVVKMKDDDSQRSTLTGDHDDAEYNETLNQMYDMVLASLDHRTIKAHRKKSLFRRTEQPEDVRFEGGEPKSDNSSTSTASSDGTHGHHYETQEAMKAQDEEPPTSFLGSTVKGSAINLKKAVVIRLQRGWRAFRGSKPIEVFLHEARYPSEARATC